MSHVLKPLISLLMLALLSACSIFSADESEQPAELQSINEQFRLQRLWSVNVGNGQGRHYNRLTPAIDGATIYAAAADGTVMAIDKVSGNVRWRQRTDYAITGAVGAAAGLVVFGTRDARIVALSQTDGRELWTTTASSEVLAAPAVDSRIVVTQSVDGRLVALNAADGQQRWVHDSTVPALSLRGTSKPLISGNVVVAGFANGLIAGIDANNGLQLWEERVAVPQGRYDIERIIDIDGDPVLSGSTVFVSSYQGNLMGLDLMSGRIVWGMAGSSYNSLALGLGNIYWVNNFGHVIAVQNNTERTVWENRDLRLRKPSSPTTINNYVAVGDFEGYLHLMSQIDGNVVSRIRVDRSGVRANILAEPNLLYVYGNSGQLMALRLP
ncbi:MAG: outer membrane protein assembly factor BamB [Pseudohongiella sp.]|nr:outer membrane protein assembly factor BamB [Pseudohongiella sp.]MDO9519996.1 outer membrane protein assembly factor BamB [Pseudohongiella sp.]MDP2127159.1 outer membrane protein assembly factor BamB [Pseudohongiella sp.]